MSAGDTIFALSSGQVPAAIGIIRISGPDADYALEKLTGRLPKPRVGTLVKITNPVSDEYLDEALCLWFPGPNSATGEDLAEIHCHGGRAVIRSIEAALEQIKGLRRAEPGEFTRRAFSNGRIDLAEAEGLSDLLFAETEWQRKAAIQSVGGSLSRQTGEWLEELLRISALIEADLDFADEDDVAPEQMDNIHSLSNSLASDIEAVLSRPRVEKLKEGLRVVLGGPPNSGKSTLLNALVEREAAIVSDIAGTTRDVIEVPVSLGGIPFLFIDTAGLRDEGIEQIEQIGIERARGEFEKADLILWLGPEGQGPDQENLIEVASKADLANFSAKSEEALSVSPKSGEGMQTLADVLIGRAKSALPPVDQIAVNQRQGELLNEAKNQLEEMEGQTDLLIMGEHLRLARRSLDAITGKASTEDMLDALFGKFCIGK